MNCTSMKQKDYTSTIGVHISDLMDHYTSLLSDGRPEIWLVTKTFRAAKDGGGKVTPIVPSRCFGLDEQLYVHVLSRLTSNFDRKRHLQPRTYTYYDLPCSKRDKSFATLSSVEQRKTNGGRVEHPEIDTHLHSVMLIHPTLTQRFGEIASTFEQMFQSLNPANRSLDAQRLKSLDELRRTMLYASKLLKQPTNVLQELAMLRDVDWVELYTILPKSSTEPTYTKCAYERELVDDRAFRGRHTKGALKSELESGYLNGSRLIPRSARKLNPAA
jgi:hypothetical protein